MYVKLIASTKPKIDLSGDDFIAYVARVSNPANQQNKSTAPKLIKYLKDNHHWSPFEMAHAVMEIYTTRDIARQILRHRSFSFQEFSQRYAKATDLGFATREARLQDEKNRQNSIDTDDPDLQADWFARQQALIEKAKSYYDWAIRNGIAKEQARAVLPEGLTISRIYMAGSVRSWIHYCELRMDKATQKEHREVAAACWDELTKEFSSLKGD